MPLKAEQAACRSQLERQRPIVVPLEPGPADEAPPHARGQPRDALYLEGLRSSVLFQVSGQLVVAGSTRVVGDRAIGEHDFHWALPEV